MDKEEVEIFLSRLLQDLNSAVDLLEDGGSVRAYNIIRGIQGDVSSFLYEMQDKT